MFSNNVESFKLVIRPGDQKLKSGDYWAIVALCSVGAGALFFVVGGAI